VLLPEVVAHLFRWNPLAGVDLGGGPIDMGESFGRKKVIEVLSFFVKIMLQHFGDVFVDRCEASSRCAALSLLIELIIQLNLVHGSRVRWFHCLFYDFRGRLSLGMTHREAVPFRLRGRQ